MKQITSTLWILACLLLFSSQAWGYNLMYKSGSPVRWHGEDEGGFLISNVSWKVDIACANSAPCENTLPGGTGDSEDFIGAMDAAFDQWETATCSQIRFAYDDFGTTDNYNYNNDDITHITADDPSGTLDTGTLAATVTWHEADFQSYNGINFRKITNMDVIFNDQVSWSRHETLAPGKYDIEAVALHEFGHGIGYAHSCESGETCNDPDLKVAIMYWSIGPNNPNKNIPLTDDLAMHSVVYGPNLLSSITANVSKGALPLAVQFALNTFSDATNLTALWTFGDGETETITASTAAGLTSPSHNYTEAGQYDVSVGLQGATASCQGGTFEHEAIKTDFITACEAPTADFTYTVDGLTVQFLGDAGEGSQIGCVDKVTWDFGDGSDLLHTSSPEHTYSKEGSYTVTFFAEGTAGTSETASGKVTVDEGGCLCTVSPGRRSKSPVPAVWGLLALVSGLLVRRRRQPQRGR